MSSYWKENTKETNYASLTKNIKTEVCIVGAGITGIATAYELAKIGKKVVLIDRDRCAMGVSANTTGKITSQHGLIYKYLIDTFGIKEAKDYLEANEQAIKTIKQNIDENNIECDFEYQDSYIYTNDENEVYKLQEEIEALKKLGFEAEYCTKTPLPFKTISAIKFKNQAQFNIRKYLISLLKVLENKKVEIYENTKMTNIEKGNNAHIVITEGGNIEAENIVLTTHYPIINFPGYHFLKMYQDRSYIIAVETKQKLFDRNVYI